MASLDEFDSIFRLPADDQVDDEITVYVPRNRKYVVTGHKHPTESAQPADELERARECAIQVLANCAAYYANPEQYAARTPNREQHYIDIAINTATDLVGAFAHQLLSAERKRVLEEACKAVCIHCRIDSGSPAH